MNKPSSPGTFPVAHSVEMSVNFADRVDDQRRIAAELWCCHRTRRRWVRRVLTERGIVVFEFEDADDAARFQRAN